MYESLCLSLQARSRLFLHQRLQERAQNKREKNPESFIILVNQPAMQYVRKKKQHREFMKASSTRQSFMLSTGLHLFLYVEE